MMGNAWGVFNDHASPDLFFVVLQVAMSLLTISYVVSGRTLFPKELIAHRFFRLAEIILLSYASYYFYSILHYHLMSLLQAVSVAGLCYLLMAERYVFKSQFIQLEKDGIHLPAAEKNKLISWNSVENLRIRNDYVSVNTTENRFIQFETNHIYTETELDSMNAWCFQQLPSNKNASGKPA